MNIERRKADKVTNRPLDFLVVFLCLSGIAVSLYLFYIDLFKTFRSLSEEPAGAVVLRHNTVQRRLKDRVIWDRLFVASPVYEGDLIRIARMSGAMLNIDENYLELGESTLIRIQREEGVFKIEFFEGEINLSSSQDSGIIFISIGDRVIEAAPGAAFSASSGEAGIALQVNEGIVQIMRDGQSFQAPAGSLFMQDADGNEISDPMAAVMQPRPNARFLKTEEAPLDINFAWARFNMQNTDLLRLEIAHDRNFGRVSQRIENLDSSAVAAVEAGMWHWRLSLNDNILTTGRMTVTEAAPPLLLHPEDGRRFIFKSLNNEVQFRWSENADAASFFLQVSDAPNFLNPLFSVQVQGTTHIARSLDTGTLFWRVIPVFSSGHEGQSRFSQTSSFRIDLGGAMEAPSLNTPSSHSSVITTEGSSDVFFSWGNVQDAASYTIQISKENDLSNPVLSRSVRNNYYALSMNESGSGEANLDPGHYYWGVSYTDTEGDVSPFSQSRLFTVSDRSYSQKLLFPPDDYKIEEAYLPDLRFSWDTDLAHDARFQVSSRSNFNIIEIDIPVTEDSYRGIHVHPGDWFWRITAKPDRLSQSVSSAPRRFTLSASSVTEPVPAAQQAAAQTADTAASVIPPELFAQPEALAQEAPLVMQQTAPPPQVTVQPQTAQQAAAQQAASQQAAAQQAAAQEPTPLPPLRLTLASPAQDATIPGLIALRQPTIFRWECDEEIASSRFVLSRNANPTLGRPEVEIANPGRTVTVNRLGEGLWYWTVVAQSPDGRSITALAPRRLRVQSVPLFSVPENMTPAQGHTINADALRQQRSITFNWEAVEGANAYFITIFRDTPQRRQQIYQSDLITGLSYSFESLTLLDYNATFYWQVEGVFYSNDGMIEQRGRPGENSFVLDVPRPGRVQGREMGVLYGN
ncbi:MAG: hypothetical protein LBU66_03430 [Treponema sp.]|jgi:hypothetical protein|nr:hypothetical protein [Treponema sp.]